MTVAGGPRGRSTFRPGATDLERHPNDRLLRWDETNAVVSVFRSPAGYVNGNTLDPQGRLVSCEQGNRRVTRTEHDGSITVLASRYDGKRLNSPNDAAVKADGSVWFTDPDFGITSDYEGHRADSEIGACNVYRIAADGDEVSLVDQRHVGPERHRLQRGRADGVRLRQPREPRPGLRRRRGRADPVGRAGVRVEPGRVSSTTSAWTTVASSGSAPVTMASIATRRTAR